MNILELIAKLTELKEKYGDSAVKIESEYGYVDIQIIEESKSFYITMAD